MKGMVATPIPGESLTMEPKNSKWEKPAQFTNVDKAMDYLVRSLLKKDKLARLVAMMDAGAPVEAVVRVILFGGFYEGKWNPDLGVLLQKPLAGLIITAYYNVTGKKPKALTFDDGKADVNLANILALKRGESNTAPEITNDQIEDIRSQAPKTGLMGAI